MKQKREGLCGKYRAWPTWQQSAGIAPALVMWELVSLSECQPIRVEYCGLNFTLGRNTTLYHRVPYEALVRPARGTDPVKGGKT